ncbi:MAG: poly(3-hydroxybutyrate) depolymerase, partial [Paracoccaceae bacterium]
NLPDDQRLHYVQEKVGHFGVFNGSRWRQHIQPRVRDFIRAQQRAVRGGIGMAARLPKSASASHPPA